MKKTYKQPSTEITRINVANIVCASAHFGDDTTDTMHAKERGDVNEKNFVSFAEPIF